MNTKEIWEKARKRKNGYIPYLFWTGTNLPVSLPEGCNGIEYVADECDKIRKEHPSVFWNVVDRKTAKSQEVYVSATFFSIRCYGTMALMKQMLSLLEYLEEKNADKNDFEES